MSPLLNKLLLLWLILVTFHGLCASVNGIIWSLDPPEKSPLVRYGDSYLVTCNASKPITWLTDSSDSNMTVEKQELDGKYYLSTLKVEPYFKDVYCCRVLVEPRITNCSACKKPNCRRIEFYRMLEEVRDESLLNITVEAPEVALAGQNLTLNCTLKLKEPPGKEFPSEDYSIDILWTRKRSKAPFEEIIVLHEEEWDDYDQTVYSHHSSFHLTNVMKEDSGEYTCRVKSFNSTLERYARSKFSVYDSAELILNYTTTRSLTESVTVAGRTSWEFQINSIPPLQNLKWTKVRFPDWVGNESRFHLEWDPNATDTSERSKVKLIIEDVEFSDAGEYSLLLRNGINTTAIGFSLQVLAPTLEGASFGPWGSAFGVLAAVFILAILAKKGRHLWRRKRLETSMEKLIDEELSNTTTEDNHSFNEETRLQPFDRREMELPRNKLHILRTSLGKGNYGEVVKAEAELSPGVRTVVAVKRLKPESREDIHRQVLLKESKFLNHLRSHPNIVNILRIVTEHSISNQDILLVVEYCRFGSLQSYLKIHGSNFQDQRSLQEREADRFLSRLFDPIIVEESLGIVDQNGYHRADENCKKVLEKFLMQNSCNSNDYKGEYEDSDVLQPLNTATLVDWAIQMSHGVQWIASKGVIHGDLALRNVLLTDNNIVKICDLGLAHNMLEGKVYYRLQDPSGIEFPQAWMAPESVERLEFSTQSDVWSLGIVLWEMFTLAKYKWPEKQLLEKRPFRAPQSMYELMVQCWRQDPKARPSVEMLIPAMEQIKSNIEFQLMEIQSQVAILPGRESSNHQSASPHVEEENSPSVDYLRFQPGGAQTLPEGDPSPDTLFKRHLKSDFQDETPESANRGQCLEIHIVDDGTSSEASSRHEISLVIEPFKTRQNLGTVLLEEAGIEPTPLHSLGGNNQSDSSEPNPSYLRLQPGSKTDFIPHAELNFSDNWERPLASDVDEFPRNGDINIKNGLAEAESHSSAVTSSPADPDKGFNPFDPSPLAQYITLEEFENGPSSNYEREPRRKIDSGVSSAGASDSDYEESA